MPADEPGAFRKTPDLTPQEAIHAFPNFSYQVHNYTGKGFLCVGDAHRFIDPIFAYGVYFGVQEAEFAADFIGRFLSGEIKTNGNPFADYERLCDEGNDVVEDVIGVLWEFPLAFQRIVTWRDSEAALDLLSGRIYGELGANNVRELRCASSWRPRTWNEWSSRKGFFPPDLRSCLQPRKLFEFSRRDRVAGAGERFFRPLTCGSTRQELRSVSHVASWCNGSTRDSGSLCQGSNPCEAARLFSEEPDYCGAKS